MTQTLFHYCDIETTPSQDPEILAEITAKHLHAIPPLDLEPITADGRLKDPDKIAEDLAKKHAKALDDNDAAVKKAYAAADAEWRKTSFDGDAGHIASVAWAFSDGDDIFSERNCAFDDFKSGVKTYADEVDGVSQVVVADRKSPTLADVLAGEKALLQAFVNVVDGCLAGFRHIAEEKWKASKPRMTWVDDPEFGPPHWKPADKRGMN